MQIEQITIPMVRSIAKRPRLANALFGRTKWGNPFSEEAYRDPFPAFELMRRDGPVVYSKLYQQWFVSGYDEVREFLSSPDMGVAPQAETLLNVRPYTKMSERSRTFFSQWLLLVDPPVHSRLRRLVSSAFTPRQISELEPGLHEIAASMLEPESGDWCDLAQTFTIPFPIYAISELLGIPVTEREWIHRVAKVIVRLVDPFAGFDAQEMNNAVDELYDYVTGLAAERRSDPQDDLLSSLALVEADGDRLSGAELVAMVGFLLFAGYETTLGLLGNAMIALSRHPAELEKLRARPDLWPNAIEEFLRYDSPLLADPRTALKDVTIAGVPIPKGSNIVLLLAAANRDPQQFERPTELRLDRTDPNPISFGHGIHHCLGASLARLELRVGLQAMLEVHDPLKIDHSRTVWKSSLTLRGPTHLILTR